MQNRVTEHIRSNVVGYIASVDADGVALAAIKGLHRELRAERRGPHEHERRMARLEARLAALERGGGR